jgi:hypothetical protein
MARAVYDKLEDGTFAAWQLLPTQTFHRKARKDRRGNQDQRIEPRTRDGNRTARSGRVIPEPSEIGGTFFASFAHQRHDRWYRRFNCNDRVRSGILRSAASPADPRSRRHPGPRGSAGRMEQSVIGESEIISVISVPSVARNPGIALSPFPTVPETAGSSAGHSAAVIGKFFLVSAEEIPCPLSSKRLRRL